MPEVVAALTAATAVFAVLLPLRCCRCSRTGTCGLTRSTTKTGRAENPEQVDEDTVFDAGEAGFQGVPDCDLVEARINAHRERAARAQQRRTRKLCSDDFARCRNVCIPEGPEATPAPSATERVTQSACSDLLCSFPAWPGSYEQYDYSDEVLLAFLQRECSELQDLLAELKRQHDFEELHCLV
jgi:hypothetical protein